MVVDPVAEIANKKMQANFGRIGVLMGGPSTERQISLKSGKAVYEALKQTGLMVEPIDIKSDNTQENTNLLNSYKIDCAFIALHGRFGEDGQIQELLETLKIPYTGSGVAASKLAMDKVASLRIFEANGLNVPKSKVLEKGLYNPQEKFSQDLGWPLVIKPATQGSSIGLSIIEKEEELSTALALAFSYDERVIIEEYIKGREVTVGILNEVALPVIEIVPKNKFFDFQAKYQHGMTDYIVPAELKKTVEKDVKEAALSAHRLLGCFGCSRVDIILDRDETPFILEINTIPGFTSTSLLPKAAKTQGLEFRDLCLELIKLAYVKK